MHRVGAGELPGRLELAEAGDDAGLFRRVAPAAPRHRDRTTSLRGAAALAVAAAEEGAAARETAEQRGPGRSAACKKYVRVTGWVMGLRAGVGPMEGAIESPTVSIPPP